MKPLLWRDQLLERRHAGGRCSSPGLPRRLAAALVIAATLALLLQGGLHWAPACHELRSFSPRNATQDEDDPPPHHPDLRAPALPSPLPPLLLSALGLPRNRSVGHVRASYTTQPPSDELARQRAALQAHLQSEEFKAAQLQRSRGPRRGIVINTGGKLLPDSLILLRVLRRVVNCTLPVELAWHGAAEMDDATLASLQADFGPIRGYDISALPYPAHHRQGIPVKRFMYKAMSIMVSHFQQVLLLDADNIPLHDPSALFDHVDFEQYGNFFWPDFLRGTHQHAPLYSALGLNAESASAALQDAKGDLPERETESGQLMLDLTRHADVAQFAFLLNTFDDVVGSLAWGDKDLFALAFAEAGKAHLFSAVQVPPGLTFSSEPDAIRERATDKVMPGFRCAGILHFDPAGRTAFLHRNSAKFADRGRVVPVDLLTGPIPWRWLHYYVHPKSLGPFGSHPVHWVYSAPAKAFDVWAPNPPRHGVRAVPSEHRWAPVPVVEACPVATFLDYWHMRELGLPVGANATLDTACRGVLQRLLGAREFERRDALGFIATPELVNLVEQHPFEQVAHKDGDAAAEVPDPTPVPAWRVGADTLEASVVDTNTLRALRLMHATPDWLRENSARFPGVSF